MNNIPKVIDLFAGVGGLSLGAARAGFNVSSAVEIDSYAINAHAVNFPNTSHLAIDVSALSGRQLLDASGLLEGELDGLIGGPPCQGFSVIGPRNTDDIRNDLFNHFFRLVHETKPSFFVAENVPGIMHRRYDLVRENAFSWIKDEYELLEPISIKANLYGAPTSRTRIFFVGYNPKKYKYALSVSHFKPDSSTELTVVEKALIGLPTFTDPAWQDEKSSWQKVDINVGGRFIESVLDRIPIGVGSPYNIKRLHQGKEVSGFLGTIHSKEVAARYSSLLPGQQDYISKSVRLNPLGYCPTIRAGTSREKGSFQAVRPIHYSEARVINPREAARLQGFPDWFSFHPTKWHSFRQIGNSVSPIVAEHVLSTIRKYL
ncbi:DNA cytosine methyltransferase [Spirosoma sp. 209]|uniref:DNA cytosine methyltransferase n=1 Tax=Spirosoma sp. 209 TaxID=1955701 RepID=UPI00098CFD2D|nr:DNA cytosine methyltransferase [Spirosoma sp. 209]